MLIDMKPVIEGTVTLIDPDSGKLVLTTQNSINFENLSYALALSLGDRLSPTSGIVTQMVFGNGASSVSAVNAITYLPPNVTGIGATLYNQTYAKIVDDNNPANADPTDNFMVVNHTNNTTYSDLVVTCLLDYNEPAGQAAFDDASLANGTYIFDELGLMTVNSGSAGLLLTHAIFNPVQKSLNRRIQVVYQLRIVMN
jgi:hypothetical protein